MMLQIPEYDKTNYLTIPLGVTPRGKTVYLRVPHDEQERFFGGVFWKLMNLRQHGLRSLPQTIDYTAGQMPSLNPAFKIGRQWPFTMTLRAPWMLCYAAAP